jgi:hypothetical protein
MGYLSQIKTSREHFIEQCLASKNPSIQEIGELVKAGQRKLADWNIFSAMDVSGLQNFELFETQDQIETSIINIASSKLEKNQVFLPDRIQLLSAVVSGTEAIDSATLAAQEYGVIAGGLRNAQWTFEVNDKVLIPQQSAQVFVTSGLDVPAGVFPLTNPKIIEDDVRINFEVRSKVAMPARTVVKLILYGTVTIPN